MKIAYINYLPYEISGVEKKIKYQAISSVNEKLNIDFYIINSNIEKKEKSLIFKKIPYGKIFKKFCRYFIIKRLVDFEKYDYVIIRYSGVDFSFFTLKEYYKKIITEHHTFEDAEALSNNNFIRYLLEKFLSKFFLKYVKAFIGVTREIINYENRRYGYKPSVVISNGIAVDSIPFTKFKPIQNNILNIIFVASYFAPWHGLDIFVKKLFSYKGDVKIVLHIVGEVSKNDKNLIENVNHEKIEIKLHSKKYGDELDKLFALSSIALSSIALSSIALSSKKMNEASPLKTREYIARGIPFVYGYEDSDLTGDEKFALKIDKDNFSFDEIVKFAKKVSVCKNISYKMREFAKEKLDWGIKMKQMYNFVKNLDK